MDSTINNSDEEQCTVWCHYPSHPTVHPAPYILQLAAFLQPSPAKLHQPGMSGNDFCAFGNGNGN